MIEQLILEINNKRGNLTEEETKKYVKRCLDLKVPVRIDYRNEKSTFQYSIQVVGTEFYLDSFPILNEVKKFCKKWGLEIYE